MNYSITLLWHRVLYSMQHSVERVDSTEKWKQTCRNPCALASEPINRCMDSINRCMETPMNRCMDSINRGTETPINRCTWITWIDAWKQLSMSKQMSGKFLCSRVQCNPCALASASINRCMETNARKEASHVQRVQCARVQGSNIDIGKQCARVHVYYSVYYSTMCKGTCLLQCLL